MISSADTMDLAFFCSETPFSTHCFDSFLACSVDGEKDYDVVKSEQVQMLSMDPDGIAQPVAVEEEKGLSNVPLISAEDETYEEKVETPVDVIKDKAKGDVDPIILSQQRVGLHHDEIEEEKS
ncbi:hypothetical protein TNIN_44461 [Trichonephila inaurata madagascariensis]|uniref:Uncharacterized protein n=1 Tax=Trichonephila inaurata madagascariensis TaxID=2747483 RepID=A0A8X6YFC9_9ARAC|nr:hypothetical protein TNIN_44461 [Trichonephila inaurata madagascariensis]